LFTAQELVVHYLGKYCEAIGKRSQARRLVSSHRSRVDGNCQSVVMPHDRIRYALNRVNKAEASWSVRELFFLVKMFFPAETRSSISKAAATLCTCGDFSISGRRYKMKALKPVKTEGIKLIVHK
jgi:hypothetical protein